MPDVAAEVEIDGIWKITSVSAGGSVKVSGVALPGPLAPWNQVVQMASASLAPWMISSQTTMVVGLAQARANGGVWRRSERV